MGFDVRIGASTDLQSVRRALKQIGDKGLGKQLAAGLRKASDGLRAEIRAEVPKAMPSGYAPVLSKSLRFRQQIQSDRHTARVTFRTYADGQRERRDVPSLNKGTLRHPVFGRRKVWVAQRVRPGFVDRPADRLGPDIRRQMDAVVDSIADQITKAG